VESLDFIDSRIFDFASGYLVEPFVVEACFFTDGAPMTLVRLQEGYGARKHGLSGHA